MCRVVKNVFNSSDLPGEFLCTPLKAYHHFFAEKIRASSGPAKGAWIVANIVTGIFAYPIFAALAFIGMLVKPAGIPSLRKHNERQITLVEGDRDWIKACPNTHRAVGNDGMGSASGYQIRQHRAFAITEAGCDRECDAIVTEIQRCSQQFKQIYFVTVRSAINSDGSGQHVCRLNAFVPISG